MGANRSSDQANKLLLLVGTTGSRLLLLGFVAGNRGLVELLRGCLVVVIT